MTRVADKTVYRQLTAQVLMGEFIPALQRVSQMPWKRDAAMAVSRNFFQARKTIKMFEDERIGILRSFTNANKDGSIKQVKRGEALVPDFRDEAAEKTYVALVNDLHTKRLFKVKLSLISMDEVPDVEFEPVILEMLQPMWEEQDADDEDATTTKMPVMTIARKEPDLQEKPDAELPFLQDKPTETDASNTVSEQPAVAEQPQA